MSAEQRHQAERVFLEFRSTKNPYQLCRELLEKSTSDYVLFEAAGLIKSALIREWTLLSENDISSLREYLLNYLLRNGTPPFLREKLLQVIMIFNLDINKTIILCYLRINVLPVSEDKIPLTVCILCIGELCQECLFWH